MFDTAILINHRSTDNSCEIIRSLAPHWEIVETTSRNFDARSCDEEVMYHESRYDAELKIVLNITEFLICDDIVTLERMLGKRLQTQAILSGALMVDHEPDRNPDREGSLPAQKCHGVWETDIWYAFVPKRLGFLDHVARSRIAHCSPSGEYDVGRHRSKLRKKVKVDRSIAAIWWYGFAPFTEETVRRKMQIAGQIAPDDLQVGFGRQHLSTRTQIKEQYEYLKKRSARLSLASMTSMESALASIRGFSNGVGKLENYKRVAKSLLRR